MNDNILTDVHNNIIRSQCEIIPDPDLMMLHWALQNGLAWIERLERVVREIKGNDEDTERA
jgi:hypothetical protein